MQKTAFFILLSLAMAATTISCSKDDHSPGEVEIKILSPSAGQTFSLNQVVPLQADITAKEELHGWEITLRKKSDNSTLYSKSKHTHGKVLKIREEWTNNVTHHTDVIFEVKVELDHNGSTPQTATVQFHCHPN